MGFCGGVVDWAILGFRFAHAAQICEQPVAPAATATAATAAACR